MLLALVVALCSTPSLPRDPVVPGTVQADGLPSDYRARYLREIQSLRTQRYVEDSRYDEVESLVREADEPAEIQDALKALTQLMFDHDRGNRWVAELAGDLVHEDLAAVDFDVVPERLELLHVVLKDGRELVGTGGPLARHFPGRASADKNPQQYIQPNLGLRGLGSFWIAHEMVRKMERVPWPAPKAFLRSYYDETVEENGELVIDGLWFFPKQGSRREVIRFQVMSEGSGGTAWVAEEYGLRCVQLGRQWNGPREDGFPERTTSPQQLANDPEVGELLDRIESWREQAPSIEWWEPFDPEPELLRAAAADRSWQVQENAVENLLRLRHQLIHGANAPEFANTHPHGMVELERRVLMALQTGDATAVTRISRDWRAVLAAIQRAPSSETPPSPGAQGEHYLAFPDDYTPWRRFPLLVALHGQYCEPSWDFQSWRDLANRAGMILLCPRYGSTRGTTMNQETDQTLLGLVRYYCLRYNVDPDRVYLTGMSMGGATTWHLAMSFPSRWAAVCPEIHSPRVINHEVPRLRNLWNLPTFVLEGEFDGLNAVYSRKAVQQLTRMKAPVHHFEAGWFGHARVSFQYPEVLRYFQDHPRESRPERVEHLAFHRMRGESHWLAIREPERAAAWERTDASFALQDLTGVKATYAKGSITLRRTEGKPKTVEVFYDPVFMQSPLKIQVGGRSYRWTPEPSIETMIRRAHDTGERGQVYPDSYVVEM